MIDENVLYLGKVRVVGKTRNGVVFDLRKRNNGTQKLFRGLCWSLLGFGLNELKPKYITLAKGIIDSDGNFTNGESLLNNFSNVFGTYDSQNNRTKFVGTISAYQVKDRTPQEETIYICILTGEHPNEFTNDDVLAYIEAPLGVNELEIGTVLSIEWAMSFTNKEQQS